MENKFKIDLSNPTIAIVDNNNVSGKQDFIAKKKISVKKKKHESSIKTPIKNINMIKISTDGNHLALSGDSSKKKKKSLKKTKNNNENETPNEKVKINSNSIISLSNVKKDGEKVDQRLSFYNKQKPRQWEKRWVLMPNVFEFSKEIWLKRWVQVDGREENNSKTVR